MIGVEIAGSKVGRAHQIGEAVLKEGVLVGVYGSEDQVIRCQPSLTLSREEAVAVADGITKGAVRGRQ